MSYIPLYVREHLLSADNFVVTKCQSGVWAHSDLLGGEGVGSGYLLKILECNNC